MGPCEDPLTSPENQDARRTPRTWGCQRRARRPRSRLCLLKGCERVFRPQHSLTRYCSEPCREKARRWREWKARRRYRQSGGGKQKRQAQSRRYRWRRKEKGAKSRCGKRREGHPHRIFFRTPATALGAMRSFSGVGGRRCRGFVRMPVAVLWNGFWSGRGAGGNGSSSGSGLGRSGKRPAEPGGPPGDESLPISS